MINNFFHANNINVKHKGKGKHEGIGSSCGMRKVSFSSSNDLRKLHLSSTSNLSAEQRTEKRNSQGYGKKKFSSTFYNLRRHSDSTGPRGSENFQFMRNIVSAPNCGSEHRSFVKSGLNEDWEKINNDSSSRRSTVDKNLFLAMLEVNKPLTTPRIDPIQNPPDKKNRNQRHNKVTRVPWVQKASSFVHKVVSKVKEQESTNGIHDHKNYLNSRLQACEGHRIIETSHSADFLMTHEEHPLYALDENSNDLLRHKNTGGLEINSITGYDGNHISSKSHETKYGKHPEVVSIPGCLYGKKSDQSSKRKITSQTLYYDPW